MGDLIIRILKNELFWTSGTTMILAIGLIRDLCSTKANSMHEHRVFKYKTRDIILEELRPISIKYTSQDKEYHYLESEKLGGNKFKVELMHYIESKCNDRKYRTPIEGRRDNITWDEDDTAQKKFDSLFKKYLRC
jgi:hypothetical protein